jgi:hypothetical protein
LWRIDFVLPSEELTGFNTLIGTANNEVVAVNDARHTWFRLDGRTRLRIPSSLFTFGLDNRASSVRVAVRQVEQRESHAGGNEWHVAFSYGIKTKVGGEMVRGRVWGEFRVKISDAPPPSELPWRPLDLHTGLDQVDRSLQEAFAKIEGTPLAIEMHVSRQLENGVVMHQLVRRRIGKVSRTTSEKGSFEPPAGYHYQEPLIGVPGK